MTFRLTTTHGALLCALALAFAIRASAAEEEKPRVAVLNWEARGASGEEAEAVAEQVRAAFTQTNQYTVVDRTLTSRILEEWERQQSGLNEAERAVQVGRLYNVRYVVTGKLIRLSDQEWLLSSALLDTETGVTKNAVSLPHQGKFFSLLKALPDLSVKLAVDEAAPDELGRAAAVRKSGSSPPVAGQIWRDPATEMEFVWIPGGSFELGCHSGNRGECDSDEFYEVGVLPTKPVRLDGFWIGKSEVTQRAWKTIMGSNPSHFTKGDNWPVENVSWLDAQDFMRLLNARSSVLFRLPSEAEWEFACRSGGGTGKFGTHSGRLDRNSANYGRNECCRADAGDGYENTAPVASFLANPLGLHDMTGNVWEWTEDLYDAMGYRKTTQDNPVFRLSGENRVLRGGSWMHSPKYQRCSERLNGKPTARHNFVGFRLVMTM